jgi:hypothetical protein
MTDNCQARLLAGRSADDAVVEYAIGEQRHQIGEGTVVAFDCGSHWIADFEEGFGSLTGIAQLVNATFVVFARGAGYLVDAVTKACEHIPGLISAYIPSPPYGVVCATQTDVLLLRASTDASWRTTISSDGVSLLSVSHEVIRCSGWDAATNADYEFQVGLVDGAVLSRHRLEEVNR